MHFDEFFAKGREAVVAAALSLPLTLGLSVAAQAQENQTPQLGNWIKICQEDPNTKKEACIVTQEVRTDKGEFLASASIRDAHPDEGGKVVTIAVPVGLLLQPGIRLQVDEGEQKPGKYLLCLPNACYAEVAVKDDYIAELKRGNNLIVSVINNQGKAVGVGITLIGFTKAYDGPPVDRALLEEQRKKLQEQLQKRAEEAREKLIEEQQQNQTQQPSE